MTEAAPTPNPAAANLAGQPLTEEALRGNLTGFVGDVIAHYGAIAENGTRGKDFKHSRGVGDRPPYPAGDTFSYPDGSTRGVVVTPDGRVTTTVELSEAVADRYGRRTVVTMTEGGDQPTTYSLGFKESDKKLTRKQIADGVSVKGPARYTWTAEKPISTSPGGFREFPVEEGTAQFKEVAALGGAAERGWQNMLENLNPNNTYNLPRSGGRLVTAVAAAALSAVARPFKRHR